MRPTIKMEAKTVMGISRRGFFASSANGPAFSQPTKPEKAMGVEHPDFAAMCLRLRTRYRILMHVGCTVPSFMVEV
jgi:hypothetical protein